MSFICPTVTAYTVDEYRDQMDAIRGFSNYVHVDLGDGYFTTKMVEIADVWWPDHITASIHLMYEEPLRALPELLTLNPDMVIIHAEARDAALMLGQLRENNVRAGVSLLQGTSVDSVADLVRLSDHILIFSGSLGSFGGQVDFSLLRKVKEVKSIAPDIEIGWDGGVNLDNVRKLADGGIDVLNVGGAIQKANHPENAYRDLTRQLYA